MAGCLLLGGVTLAGDGPPEKELGPKSTGKVFTSKAPDGLAYDYYLPKGYDPEKGITLTFILHGSNQGKWWGFSMHPAGKFRPEDFVVSPDGTTPNGQGGHNSLQTDRDLKRLHELHRHLKERIKVNATYIYGLSQGSFFAHFYAGHHGEEVQGIVAHGSGLWIGSGLAKKNHHQAISVQHGRGDPVYPYGGGVGAYQGYVDAKYPLRKFRTLELDLHWAPWGHQAQQLAWCEGMTSPDPERVLHDFEWLENVKDSDGWFLDPVSAYQVAKRVAAMEGMDPKARARAAKLAAKIDGLAQKHVAAIDASYAKTKKKVTASATWPAHARYFLRDWQGVPAADAFAKSFRKTKEKHDDVADDAWKDYDGALKKGDKRKAFAAGIDVIEKGFLNYWASDAALLKNLKDWREDAKDHGIPSASVKRYDKVVKPFLDATAKGKKAYASLNRKL
jgi:hypothetical protein